MSNSNSRDEWDAMWEVTRCPVPTPVERDEHTALRDAVAAERAAERAAVVAWLREQREYGTDALLGQGFANVCNILSNEIERGEHRREEKE
jgi:hypothetical protein